MELSHSMVSFLHSIEYIEWNGIFLFAYSFSFTTQVLQVMASHKDTWLPILHVGGNMIINISRSHYTPLELTYTWLHYYIIPFSMLCTIKYLSEWQENGSHHSHTSDCFVSLSQKSFYTNAKFIKVQYSPNVCLVTDTFILLLPTVCTLWASIR